MSPVNITIIQYPGAMKSAIEGLRELFELANKLLIEQDSQPVFNIHLWHAEAIATAQPESTDTSLIPRVIILPPCLSGEFYQQPQSRLADWLCEQHAAGTLLCSVCAGAFILAQTGLLNQRPATTHWALAASFAECFPQVRLDDSKILINDNDLITTGGLMAWLDLGLELVAQFSHPALMRQLGKRLVVDTGPREQRYYRCFIPRLNHGDRTILQCQHYLQRHFNSPLTVSALAENCHLTERTFLRRFVAATDYKPKEYMQQLRISKACDALESSQDTVDLIAQNTGYEDVSAFRKTFIKITGLTPREFRSRFGTFN